MRAYFAIAKIDLLLASRNRSVIFFNYVFPLIFFFIFGQLLGAERAGITVQVVTMVLILGVLGNGLFGAGMRAVQEREMNILRRFKVAPISPVPILVASMVTGWITFLPLLGIVLLLARQIYGMPFPQDWLSLLVLISMGIVAFRAIGLIVGAVVNSVQEASIVMQILYLPMLLLSGATFPVTMLPEWMQMLAQFMPATYLATGIQGVLVRGEGIAENLVPLAALLLTAVLATFVAAQLFRWEKEEKIRGSAKVWILAVMAPFFILGIYQAWSRDHVTKTKAIFRDVRRSAPVLIRNVRVFTGEGRLLESAAVFVEGGRIAFVREAGSAEETAARAQVIEGAGKTLLPGLIDLHVRLSAPGTHIEDAARYRLDRAMSRHLSAYLFSGVTTVHSVGDPLDFALRQRGQIRGGADLAPELFVSGPVFTAPEGLGSAEMKNLPPMIRSVFNRELIRAPKDEAEARAAVRELADAGVDRISVSLETQWRGQTYERMPAEVFAAILAEANQHQVPVFVRTGDAESFAEAIRGGAAAVEGGSYREQLPDELFREMARRQIYYIPMLAVAEAARDLWEGRTALLDRTLARQVTPPAVLDRTRREVEKGGHSAERGAGPDLDLASGNLRRAHAAGVPLAAGSGAGEFLLVHGPGVLRELELWTLAGIPAHVAIEAATANAARLSRIDGRTGQIRPGYQADLLMVEGNPFERIQDLERIWQVFSKGEMVEREDLLNGTGPGTW